MLLQISPETKHPWIVRLEKPGAAQTLQWRGANLPFLSKSADVMVPASGVVVVDSLKHAAGGYAQAFSGNGAQSIGQGEEPAPNGVGYTVYIAFLRPDLPRSVSGAYPELRALNAAAEFAAFLNERGPTP